MMYSTSQSPLITIESSSLWAFSPPLLWENLVAQRRKAKRANTLWHSCPPFYSAASTIGTMVGQVNVSIQRVSRSILSTACECRSNSEVTPIWNEIFFRNTITEMHFLLLIEFQSPKVCHFEWRWETWCRCSRQWDVFQTVVSSEIRLCCWDVIAMYEMLCFAPRGHREAPMNSYQRCVDESHFLFSQQMRESWCGKPC